VTTQQGLVVASHGRHCIVETADGSRLLCHPRGKKSRAVVGDHVLWQPTRDEGTVEKILERRNLFYRQDEIHSKSFAANVDQILVLLAAEPVFSESQLARALIAAEAAGITPLVVLNKSDLASSFAQAWARLAPYHQYYPVLPLSLMEEGGHITDDAPLWQHLNGKVTLVLGPSGSGKSTLVNALVPHAAAATGAISQALQSGKHTTTSTTWYWVDAVRTTALIDSPGFQEFGLHHLAAADIARYMPDMGAHASECRFYNCTHIHEPGCAVRVQVDAGSISANRYRIYGELFAELSRVLRY